MKNEEIPKQMEFITNYVKNTNIELKGENLSGEIDSMYGRYLMLLPTDPELKSIFSVTTSMVVVDNNANSIEGETELMINMYNYDNNLGIHELYGLFCYATIFNFLTMTNACRDKHIKHNNEFYRPTIIIPSFEAVLPDIIKIRKTAYGEE